MYLIGPTFVTTIHHNLGKRRDVIMTIDLLIIPQSNANQDGYMNILTYICNFNKFLKVY